MRTTTCKVIVYEDYIIIIKNVSTKENWLLGDIDACVETPPITIIKAVKLGLKKESNYSKVKLWRNPLYSTSKTYKEKLALFENVEPE